MRSVRTIQVGVTLLAAVLAGCAPPGTGMVPGSGIVTPPTSSGPPPGTRITAEPVSTAFRVQGRDLRLVRSGPGELALQFEFVNGTDRPLTPDTVGIDQVERALLLVDLPRSTAYQVLTAKGNDGRISDSNGDVVPPGGSVTVTAVFGAPPAETTALMVLIDGLLPVSVPVQSAGAPTLLDDPVLRTPTGGSKPLVSPVLCPVVGPADAGGTKRTLIRLPSDVLFAFGRAELTPAAAAAIAAVDDEIGSGGSGTVTIEGHTDAVGGDADNQALSERRAAAVRAALEAKLGPGYRYTSVGFGEQRPVAPNTGPDGADDPDGRAVNRRVEIRTGAVEPAAAATLEPLPITSDLADAGLYAQMDGLQRVGGHLLARLTVSNPSSRPIELGPGSGLTPDQAEPIGLTLAERTEGLRQQPCRIASREYGFFHLATPGGEFTADGAGTIPPKAEVTFWAFYAAPAVDVEALDVEIGGFGETVPTALSG